MTRVTPTNIQELSENNIFVFGSNSKGHHGAGAARVAYEKFGAIWGQGSGFQGQSYAINSMSGLQVLKEEITWFISYAKQFTNVPIVFLVTEIGCGIAGYTPEEIAPLFKEALNVTNIHLPESFWEVLNKN